nr:hypothetical protein [Tanacetum cinerariifolium]
MGKAQLDTEEKLKQDAREARISKPVLIKVVQEVATEARMDPKSLKSSKIYMNNDKRNFKVYNPFSFGKFGVTEWDELSVIIPKKKNIVVEELMISLSKKRENLLSWSLKFASLGLNVTEVFLKEAFQRISDIHKMDVDSLLSYLMMASNIDTLKNQRFYTIMRSMIASHPNKEKLMSKKVKLEATGYSLD